MDYPTDSPTTREIAFGRSPSGTDLFTVNADTPVREALEQVVMNLCNAGVLCAENADADVLTRRALNQVIAQLIEASRGLVEASLDGLSSVA